MLAWTGQTRMSPTTLMTCRGTIPCTGPAQPKELRSTRAPRQTSESPVFHVYADAGENSHIIDGGRPHGHSVQDRQPRQTQEKLAGLTIGSATRQSHHPRLNRGPPCAIGTGAHDMITNREEGSLGCRGPAATHLAAQQTPHITPQEHSTHSDRTRQPRGGEHGE
jgi:hypothetical protein